MNGPTRSTNPIFRFRYELVLVVAVATFYWIGLTQHLGAGTDDVFITLYAGQALADGQGIVNYNGERVEMSSSLFHTVVVAAIDVIAPAYVFTVNKLVGGLFGALTLALLYLGRGLLFPVGRLRFIAYALTLGLLATNPAFAFWSFGGLETPFAAFFLVAYGVAVLAHRFRQSMRAEAAIVASQCAYILVRPEGFYLILFTAVYLLLLKVIAQRPIRWRILIAPVVFFTALALFRLSYFGDVLPNTVFAKNGGLAEGVANGSVYLANFFRTSPLLIAALVVLAYVFARHSMHLIAAVSGRARRVPLAEMLVFGLTLAALLVVLCSGGDWMGHYRFCVPVLPLLFTLTVTEGMRGYRAAASRIDDRVALNIVAIGVVGLLAYGNVNQSPLNIPRMLPFKNGDPGLDYALLDVLRSPEPLDETVIRLNGPNRGLLRSLDPFLTEVFPALYERHRPIVIATGQLGLFPYRMRQFYPEWNIRFIDTLGLADQTVAHLPMPKDPIGLKDGRFVDRVLSGQAGPLSEYVLGQDPNMAYMLGADHDVSENIQRLAAAGYALIWDRGNELIFLKPRG